MRNNKNIANRTASTLLTACSSNSKHCHKPGHPYFFLPPCFQEGKIKTNPFRHHRRRRRFAIHTIQWKTIIWPLTMARPTNNQNKFHLFLLQPKPLTLLLFFTLNFFFYFLCFPRFFFFGKMRQSRKNKHKSHPNSQKITAKRANRTATAGGDRKRTGRWPTGAGSDPGNHVF